VTTAPGRRSRFATDPDWSLRSAILSPGMVGIAVLTASYLRVLFHVTDVVGGTGLLIVEAGAVLAVGAVLAGRVDTRTALLGSAAALLAGMAAYYLSIPASQRALIDAGSVLTDLAALLSGLSVFRLIQAEIWVLAVLPAPLLGSWLLALRGNYPLSAAIGGSALGLFVLTGDAGFLTTLAGAVGAAVAVGFGELTPRRAIALHWDTVVLVVTAMIVLSSTVSLVPGAAGGPVLGGSATPTLEGNVVDNADNVGIVGAIRLSPEVRFSVESERQGYWRVGAYDRYTGGSWVRSGEARSYDGQLDGPPGPSIEIEQTITAESTLNSMPAVWKPVSVEGAVQRATQVTAESGLRAAAPIAEGESYRVVSQRPAYTIDDLRMAGTDYPETVEQRYLSLPDSTPDRVGERAATVADRANASTPYATAVAIESYLERNKEYSLNVERPRGSVADGFLFEMDAGYCTYYATTMAVMLRTQGVPARMVTGYTPGERVAEDEWVVRGLNAHAWVEVYFPATGWVAFDPTPSGPRESAAEQRVTQAREAGENGVDTNRTGPGEWTPTPTETTTAGTGNDTADAVTATDNLEEILRPGQEAPNGTVGNFTGGGEEGSSDEPALPTPEEVGYGLVLLFGGVAAARRFGFDTRLYRFVWLRYQPRADPVSDVERAYDRIETLLGARYRPRRPGETVEDYLDRLDVTDTRVYRVAGLYERARYGGDATAADADEAVEAADALVGERTPVLGRLRRAR
jgi:transglutaminase-like putative cysteine protease